MHLYSDLDDSGLELADDIDVAEATSLISIRASTPAPKTTTTVGMKRPTVGMKRPRTHPLPSSGNKCPRKQSGSAADCAQCRILMAQNNELRQSNALLTEQLNQCRIEAANAIDQSEAPRPGKVPKQIAETHQV